MIDHLSDCAVHNAPALEPGPCDCQGRTASSIDSTQIPRKNKTTKKRKRGAVKKRVRPTRGLPAQKRRKRR